MTRDLHEANASVERLQRIIDVAPVGIVAYGNRRQVEFLNRRVSQMTGADDAPKFEQFSVEMVHPDDQAEQEAAAVSAWAGNLSHVRVRVRNKTGDWIHVDGSMLPTFNDGVVDGVVAIYRDVSHQIEQNRAVLRFRAIAETTTDIIGITDLNGKIVYLNPAGQAFLGQRAVAFAERDMREFFEYIPAEYHQSLLRDAFAAVMRGEVWQGNVELIRSADLVRVPMSAVVVGVPGDGVDIAGIAVTYRDLSDRVRMEAELAHAAAHDSLTGLANREELFRSLESSLASGAPTAVLFFDLDNFKVVNDSLGHAAGDLVLRSLAERIRQGARGSDVVGRLGGDEFLVICRGVSTSHEAMAIAGDILSTVTLVMDLEGRKHFLSGSIGVALSGNRGSTAATLIQEADMAMYRAKRAGRRQAMLFDDSMRVEALDRLDLDRDLRLALENSQFELYFQPLVHFDQDRIESFEALIRWSHPVHGLLVPDQFLPMVERVGLSNAVGEWVIARAALAAAELRRIQPKTCIGVNVHPDQLRQPGFVANVGRRLAEAGVPGDAFAIEITEHAVMVDVDVEQTRVVLEQLRAIGMSIAIDDFGTGYSNLDLLRHLPVDYLKIDQSFVAGLGVEAGDTQLVRMVLSLSHELGIQVIAEGVETEVQATELRRLGCRIAQGYFYSRPLSLADTAALLIRQQANPPSKLSTVPVM